jgi:hypothetical protein
MTALDGSRVLIIGGRPGIGRLGYGPDRRVDGGHGCRRDHA